MGSNRLRRGRGLLWCAGSSLLIGSSLLSALGAAGCGNGAAHSSAMAGASGAGAGAESGGASDGASAGRQANAGAAGIAAAHGGSAANAGGGLAGAAPGGASSSGGAIAGGGSAASQTGGSAASQTGGSAASQTGGTFSAGGASGSHSCSNAPHVLPLNASNPQDGITLSGFYVDTDTWNAANYPVMQTMYVCDYNNWYVIANMNDESGDGAVKTYPNVHEDFSGAPRISSFTNISSRFAHGGPHVGIYEFAYDIWLNGVASAGSTEVMIWTDNYKQVPSGSVVESVSFDGQSYQVYKSGSYIAFVETTNATSGTLNLLSFFNHIIENGWIPASSTLGAIDYGVELVSTGGADARFELNDFSLTAN